MYNDEADIREQIASAFLWILGRPVDQSGLQHYLTTIEAGILDLPGFRMALLASQEFKAATTTLVIADLGGGTKVVANPAEPDFGRHVAAGGGWEPHIANAIKARLEPGFTFVDVGANIGVMAFQAATKVGSAGKVIAFEPSFDNASIFKRGIVANSFEHVRLFTFGLSDVSQMLSLNNDSNAKVVGAATALQSLEVIQAVRGDEILLSEGRIDLIKIDVEGFEYRVLNWISGTIGKFKPKLLCEFNPLCLQATGQINPAVLAEHLMSLASHGDLVEHDGSFTRIASASELMALWTQRDAEISKKGLLPKGWLHFDILLDTATK